MWLLLLLLLLPAVVRFKRHSEWLQHFAMQFVADLLSHEQQQTKSMKRRERLSNRNAATNCISLIGTLQLSNIRTLQLSDRNPASLQWLCVSPIRTLCLELCICSRNQLSTIAGFCAQHLASSPPWREQSGWCQRRLAFHVSPGRELESGVFLWNPEVSAGTKDLVIGVWEQPCTHISSLGACVSALHASPTVMDNNIGCLQLPSGLPTGSCCNIWSTGFVSHSRPTGSAGRIQLLCNEAPLCKHRRGAHNLVLSDEVTRPITLLCFPAKNFNFTRLPWGKDAVPL